MHTIIAFVSKNRYMFKFPSFHITTLLCPHRQRPLENSIKPRPYLCRNKVLFVFTTNVVCIEFAIHFFNSLFCPLPISPFENVLFFGCSSLVTVTLPAFISSIGQCAFQGFYSLVALNLANGSTS